MLRYIFAIEKKDLNTGLETKEFETIDIEQQGIENILRMGGYGETGYCHTSLVGIELLRPIVKEDK